ncbi:MAG: hypothetical protein IMZ53_06265 [Thermoplasmata archaeon]|nr:hypothetical protein [Thermoplasmata archaeon]
MNYNEIQSEIKRLQGLSEDVDSQIGERHRDIDKCGMSFRYLDYDKKIKSCGHHDWPEAIVKFDAYHGYWGNSGCSNDMTEDFADIILEALNDKSIRLSIIMKAKKLIAEKIVKLAKSALEESEKIKEFASGVQ